MTSNGSRHPTKTTRSWLPLSLCVGSSQWIRSQWFCAFACACLLAVPAAPARADVKTKDKGQVKFEGMLGTMMRMFCDG